jgi:ribonuclease P protein component
MPAPSAQRFRLRREQRLKLRREFEQARTAGTRVVCGCLIANLLSLGPGARPRLGVVTSRKIGDAVTRSRARRLLRESFRRHQHELREPAAVVLVARNSIVGKKLPDVERDYLTALTRGGLLKPANA